jgi:hypothetical protein
MSVRTFMIPFFYESGSAKVCNYITIPNPLQKKVTVPTVPGSVTLDKRFTEY